MRPSFPLYLKITGASFLVALAVLAFVGQFEYRGERAALEDKFGLTLQHIAQTTALFLDGDAHERVRSQADSRGADFRALRQVLDRVRRENTLREDQLYTLRPIGDGELEFVIMLQERTFVGSRYRPPERLAPLVRRVIAGGGPAHTPIYQTEHGRYISGYAPVRDRTGRVVALLEVDYGIDLFLDELRRTLSMRLWIVPAALLLALVLALVVARSITRAVARLVQATIAVEKGDYNQRVEVQTRDELRTLAQAFNAMLVGLRERFAMLRFVPRHTRAVIAEAVKGKDSLSLAFVAQRREVVVLFSDIRGFTALSENTTPDRVIEMLNIYQRRQAELIEQEGGSIDKFIGDAVMALFEGPERFEQALRSALRIQEAVRALNAGSAFERSVELGIGIAGGEVIMGSVGYEGRVEFAVIGRIVNLASRLTAAAGPGDIVVAEGVWERLGGRYGGERLEGLRLKGFQNEVACYRIRGAPASGPPDRALAAGPPRR